MTKCYRVALSIYNFLRSVLLLFRRGRTKYITDISILTVLSVGHPFQHSIGL